MWHTVPLLHIQSFAGLHAVILPLDLSPLQTAKTRKVYLSASQCYSKP